MLRGRGANASLRAHRGYVAGEEVHNTYGPWSAPACTLSAAADGTALCPSQASVRPVGQHDCLQPGHLDAC